MGISIWQILLIVLVVVVLFGAGRLPRLMGDMAKGIKSFKQGMKEEITDDDTSASAEPGRIPDGQAPKQPASDKDRAANS